MELRGLIGTIRDQSKAVVAPVTTRFHWEDPSLSTEGGSRCEKSSACFSVLRVAGSSPGRTSYLKLELTLELKNDLG